MLTKLIYHIMRSRDRYTYMASLQSVDVMDIHTGIPSKHKLPPHVYDQVCSVSFKGYEPREIDARHDILMCLIHNAISSAWEWDLGVPLVRIKGQTSMFDTHFIGTNIVPYFIRSDDKVETIDQYKMWSDLISFVPKITLLHSTGIYKHTVIQDYRQMLPYMKHILKQHL